MSKKFKLSKKTVKDFNGLAQFLIKRVKESEPQGIQDSLKHLDWFYSSLKELELKRITY